MRVRTTQMIELWKLEIADNCSTVTISHAVQEADRCVFDGRSMKSLANLPRPQLNESRTPVPNMVYSMGDGSLLLNGPSVFETRSLYEGLLGGTELIELSSTSNDWLLVNAIEFAPPGRMGQCEHCNLRGWNIPLFRLRHAPTDLFCVTGRPRDHHVSFKHTYERHQLGGIVFRSVWRGAFDDIEGADGPTRCL